MIVQADARNIPLADGSVQCVVTSPPYWGLRDYGVTGQIGLEPTPEAYVATMVQVFREVWCVLRDDGTVWLNLGDSYAGGSKSGDDAPLVANRRAGASRADGIVTASSPRNRDGIGRVPGLKPKDLCGMPWRVAFALQADGWYLRSDIIWAKPNPMPESVTDRPTRSHEYLFLLTKRANYFYDADAIRESIGIPTKRREVFRGGDSYTQGRSFENSAERRPEGYNGSDQEKSLEGRNRRDVWTVNSEPTPEAHFATFPQKLIEPCILAGTSEKGCCAECGAPRVRQLERTFVGSYHDHSKDGVEYGLRQGGKGPKSTYEVPRTLGWQPSCAHDAPSVPCVVFDPFLGSGTVGKVCERLGRRWAGLELSGDYISIARKRTSQMGLFSGGISVLGE